MLAALLLSACASRPPVLQPSYVYTVLYGGKFHGYPLANVSDPEVTRTHMEMTGAMCLTPDDWKAREEYIFELEAYSGK